MNMNQDVVKVKFFAIAKASYQDIKNSFKEMAQKLWYFVLIMTFAEFVLQYPYACSFAAVRVGGYFNCADNIVLRLATIFIQFLITIVFMVAVMKFFDKDNKIDSKIFIKRCAIILFLTALFLMPLLSAYFLLVNQAERHTLIELIFFLLLMIPFFGPFYVVRLLLAPFILDDNAKFLGFLDSIKKTSHNFARIVLGIFLSFGISFVYFLLPNEIFIVFIENLGIVAVFVITILFNVVFFAQAAITTRYIINLNNSLDT